MDFNVAVYALYGYFVRTHFLEFMCALNVDELQHLYKIAHIQATLWHDGVRDERIHDATFSLLD